MKGPGGVRGDELPPGVHRVRADNPSPLTLDGTNTYVHERWVIDPGPADPAHLDAVEAAAARERLDVAGDRRRRVLSCRWLTSAETAA